MNSIDTRYFFHYRGRPVFDLLKVLICTPEVPEKMAAPSDSDREVYYDSLIQNTLLYLRLIDKLKNTQDFQFQYLVKKTIYLIP